MLEKKKNNLAKILTLIAIFLILVYGLDAALDRSDTGFLPFDSKTRGLVLGLPSVILPLIAFGITYRSPSTSLGGLLIIDGIIILIGSSDSLQVLRKIIKLNFSNKHVSGKINEIHKKINKFLRN